MVAAQLVAEPCGCELLVDRLAREDGPDGLRPHLRGAAHHPLALGPVLLHEHAGDPVDVREEKRRARLLGAEELIGLGDPVVQGLRPAVPEPGVADAIGAQQHREGDAPAHEAADVLGGIDRHDQGVHGRAGAQQAQHLVDVGLAARARLLAQIVVVDRGELGHRGGQVVGEPLRQLARGGHQCGRQLSHRGRHAVSRDGASFG